MVDYSQPITATFELQRKSLEQGQQALEQTVELQHRVGDAALEGIEAQESFQRSVVEFNQEVVYTVLDALEANVPGAEDAVLELRETLDEQYDTLFQNHEELFDSFSSELSGGIDTMDELSQDSLELLADQLDVLYEAHEELEGQSVETAEEIQKQVEEIQEQAEEIQAQVQEVSGQAVDSVEA